MKKMTTSDRLEELKERFSSFANATEIANVEYERLDKIEYEEVEQGVEGHAEEQGSE